jgi:drug/metabolite transporter (DMT)-like permease
MFILLVISFYNFLIGSEGKGPERFVDVRGVVVKTLSISGAPSIILAGISFGLSKNYGNRLSGILLSFTGIVLIIGMVVSLSLSSNIISDFFHPILVLVPYIFIVGGIAILIIGFILYLKATKGIKKTGRFN